MGDFVLFEPLVVFGEEFFAQALAAELGGDEHVVEMADFADLENRRPQETMYSGTS